jgi:hypothetical protein
MQVGAGWGVEGHACGDGGFGDGGGLRKVWQTGPTWMADGWREGGKWVRIAFFAMLGALVASI